MTAETRYIALGAGGAFQNLALQGLLPVHFEYAVDNHFVGPDFEGIPVRRPAELAKEVDERACTHVVVFAMSSAVYSQFRRDLVAMGFREDQVEYYGDLCFGGLQERLRTFGVTVARSDHDFAQAVSSIFPIDNHSSSLGTAVLLGLMRSAPSPTGAVAELGAYKGGNALLVSLAATIEGMQRDYYVIDSFEGFPSLSPNDPADAARMFRDNSFADITRMFSAFPRVRVCRGFIPAVLRDLPEQSYSVVYYDCDLYQPAVDSLEYFFPRLEQGGYLLIHDYLPKRGGFDGVRKAVDAFLDGRRDVDRFDVPETTHVILRKG